MNAFRYPDNEPMTRMERFCLSRAYWPTVLLILAIGLGCLVRVVM